MNFFYDLENVVSNNWEGNFSGLQKHVSQGHKSTVYRVTDAKGKPYLLKTISARNWSQQDEISITAQSTLGAAGLMPKIHSPVVGEKRYIRNNDEHLFLQEMTEGREADFENTKDFARTKNLLEKLHGFDAKTVSLKTENPLGYLKSKNFNNIVHDARYAKRFPSETIAAVHRAFTSADRFKAPLISPSDIVVVHGDIKSEHVLFGDDESQDRLVDCDTLHLGLPEEDYARLLTSNNIRQFFELGGKADQHTLGHYQHLFLLSELSSAVNAMTSYADRMDKSKSFIQEQSEHIQKIVPIRLEEITKISRAMNLSGFVDGASFLKMHFGKTAAETKLQP